MCMRIFERITFLPKVNVKKNISFKQIGPIQIIYFYFIILKIVYF